MSNILKCTFLFLISVFFVSCAITQNTSQTSTVKAKKRSVSFLLEQLDSNKIDYTWFATKAKIKYEDSNQKVSFTAVVRMKKDSLIWLTLKKMNVEGVRVQISPEKIEILDHQGLTYAQKPFRFLKDEFGLELSFPELQDLIIGNPILFQNPELISVILENQHVLKTPESEKTVVKIFINPANFLLNKIQGSINHNSIDITYGDYEEIGLQQISTTKDIYIDSEEISNSPITLKMSFSSMVIDEPQKMNFEIPDSYKR